MGGSSGSCLVWAGLTGVNAAAGYEKFTNDVDANLDRYGVKLVDGKSVKGDTPWSMRDKAAVLAGVSSIAMRMETVKERSGVDIFRESFNTSDANPLVMVMGTSAPGVYI